jgi:hypothetical protein
MRPTCECIVSISGMILCSSSGHGEPWVARRAALVVHTVATARGRMGSVVLGLTSLHREEIRSRGKHALSAPLPPSALIRCQSTCKGDFNRTRGGLGHRCQSVQSARMPATWEAACKGQEFILVGKRVKLGGWASALRQSLKKTKLHVAISSPHHSLMHSR